MRYRITVLPDRQVLDARHGETLQAVLRRVGLAVDAPCGGQGTCGKCIVLADGQAVPACRTPVDRDMTVVLPESKGAPTVVPKNGVRDMWHLAIDLGTTTVVGYLLDAATGKELARCSLPNPQGSYGADVVSRIRWALNGQMDALTGSIRGCLEKLTKELCCRGGRLPEGLERVCLVGNPAMQQLFLGILPDNLARIPFDPLLKQGRTEDAGAYLALWKGAVLLTVPDISGFVGADTVACILAAELDRREKLTLLVDIGTNGEMVLGSRGGLTACAAAAGPALEGANISCGMRGIPGAIDHVWIENGALCHSVIGGEGAAGICGSGLVDAVAAALELGLLDSRGKVLKGDAIFLTDRVKLTQEDIRQVQLAKGAIAAGIELMAARMGKTLSDIDEVLLAGAFGAAMDPDSACRMGLLPRELAGKVTAIGNAAGEGAKLLALDPGLLAGADRIAAETEFMELSAEPSFRRCFARCMRF